ncbi:hypothetical protein [Clostridium tagluense]|uniref:Cell division protein FtsZ C-terminal domain-containing protein n=1 Tax=Clostridium tagluense TaxID=360422 RepID=A0A401UQ37_9CLOT|nr:hypothetical protein [Clostridium tagluense]GCD11673.1 hypothetical protein Ctaglu_32960 [Clostridium tagluense]
MDKDLLQYLGTNEKEVVTNYGDIDSEKLLDDEYKILNVKVFSVGLLDNETINKLNIQSTEYKEFINLKEVELEALKNNDELLSETDLVLLIGEYEDRKAMAKLEYIIQNAGLRDIKTVLLLSVNNNIDNDLIREISTKVDVLVPIIDNKVQHYAQNAFSFLDKNNLKAELAQQYINTILEFAPERISVIAPIDIIDIFAHNKGIAYVSSASATGEGRAKRAVALALSNIYSLKDYKDCKILLLTFSGGESLGLLEINEAAQVIVDKYSDEETILFTVGLDESRGSEMRVSVMGI